MQSRNQREGRYAGLFHGAHIRTQPDTQRGQLMPGIVAATYAHYRRELKKPGELKAMIDRLKARMAQRLNLIKI